MKKAISILLLLIVVIITISACATTRPKIEEYEWHLKYAMRVENEQLNVLARNEEDGAHPEAKIVDIVLVAQNGIITITDKTNNKIYTGTYVIEKNTPKGTDYKISIDQKNGYATVAMTTYHDGTEEPTLPISLGDYSLYFYANK